MCYLSDSSGHLSPCVYLDIANRIYCMMFTTNEEQQIDLNEWLGTLPADLRPLAELLCYDATIWNVQGGGLNKSQVLRLLGIKRAVLDRDMARLREHWETGSGGVAVGKTTAVVHVATPWTLHVDEPTKFVVVEDAEIEGVIYKAGTMLMVEAGKLVLKRGKIAPAPLTTGH